MKCHCTHITLYLQPLGGVVYHLQIFPLMQVFQSDPKQEVRLLPSCPQYRIFLSGQQDTIVLFDGLGGYQTAHCSCPPGEIWLRPKSRLNAELYIEIGFQSSVLQQRPK